jgi:hypothetical protein
MDEGMNSFVQYYAEKEWDPNYPSNRGPAKNIVPYFREVAQVPMMTESDLVYANYSPQAYAKPAAALVMLREQVLEPAQFDRAFREYAAKWVFKKPQPADFFRTVVNGAGENLNWWWRGMFYTTYANDQALGGVQTQSATDITGNTARGQFYHTITIEQKGGLVMPIQLGVTYDDGTNALIKLPADVWRFNEKAFTYGFFSNKGLTQVIIDPNEVLADVNRDNNAWKPVARVQP